MQASPRSDPPEIARQAEVATGAWWRLLALVGIEVRSTETRIVSVLHLYCLLLGAFQIAAKTIRQSTFVDSLGSEMLPSVYFLVAVCTYPLVRAYTRTTARAPFDRVVLGSSVLVALSMVVFWALFALSASWVPFVFYVWVSTVTIMMVSQFWTYANQALDPRQARRLFPYILSGGLIGGVAGGQIASLTSLFSTGRATLLVNIALIAGTLALVPIIDRHTRRNTVAPKALPGIAGVEDSSGAFKLIRSSGHLRSIAILMFLSIVTAQIVDLQFSWAIENKGGNLTFLFGNVYSLMGLAAFVFQLLLSSYVYRRLGVGGAMRIVPLALGGGFAVLLLLAFTPFLFVALVTMKIGENALRYSLDQGTRELLFVPVAMEVRARVKAYIDVLVQRFAKSVAALLLLTVTVGWVSPVSASWFGLVLVAVWTAQTLVAKRHYVAAFREGLLAREIDPAEGLDRSDVHTLEAIVEALGSEDRDQVLHALELLEVQDRSHLVPPLLLGHEDPAVRSATLRTLVRTQRSSARRHIEKLLTDPDSEVRTEAIQALALLTGTEEPQVLASRLRDSDCHVRAAAVTSLLRLDESEHRDAAMAALADMMRDARTETRIAAASALGEVGAAEAVHPLLQLLYDQDTGVIKAALASVTRQVSNDGKSVLFAPVLISLLRDRRLKHEAREALVASGEDVIPLLHYFMNDPVEQPWVRRALPKTISRFHSAAAQKALVDSLPTQDLFLKYKIIQALGSLRSESPNRRFDRSLINPQILEQSRLYLIALSRLSALSGPDEFELVGIECRWTLPTRPNLLQHLLIDRMAEHLDNLFGLLALVYRQREVWSSYDRLRAEHGATRGHALEYLDNSLRPSVRNHVLTVLDDLPLDRRLEEARRLFGIQSANPAKTLRQLIDSAQEEDPIALWIGLAAVDVVRRDQLEELYPLLRTAAQQPHGNLMSETASWALDTLEAA